MVDRAVDGYAGSLAREAAEVQTLDRLAGLLRTLRRRHARRRRDRELTYRFDGIGWNLTLLGGLRRNFRCGESVFLWQGTVDGARRWTLPGTWTNIGPGRFAKLHFYAE
jgi:hypothetical protein